MRKNRLTQTLTKGLRLVFIAALGTGLVLGAAPVPVAHAATITVNSTADNTIAGDGNCTLREAINNANQNFDTTGGDCTAGQAAPAIDTITLPAGTYILTGATGENNNASGDLDILQAGGDLSINGAGEGSTIIDGGYNDRIFHIRPLGAGSITVNISGVTIRNGSFGGGGGIYNNGGTVNIADSTLSGNQAGAGSGIYNNGGTVNITDSTLSGNQAGGAGGGIYNNGGTLTIADSTLSGSQAGGPGGGIYNNGGTLTIADSTLSGSQAGSAGGGIYNNVSTLTITNSTLSNNTATGGDGGSIYNNGGTLTIIDSTLSGNQAGGGGDGGGIYNTGVGSTVTITNSTLSGNMALGSGGLGGGISNSGTLNIANSTLSGNQTGDHGGGIYHSAMATNLDNVTITENTADTDGNGTGDGGGIYHGGGGPFTLKNTIVARNSDNSTVGNVHPDCSTLFPLFISSGYNLIGDGTGGAGFLGPNDQVGTSGSPIDPMLGSLANNGGDTFTHALLTGSPAIDAGHCTDIASNPVTTDQRGVARPQGTTCDIGAYEAQPQLSIGKTVTPATDVTYRGVVTYTVVLSNSGAGHATGTALTDTLPSEVDFANWVEQPTNAIEANDQITWNGTVSASTALTFAFVVTHTGNYGDVVTNTAEYSHTIRGSDDATFTVIPASYLPIIQTNNVITP